MKQSLKVVLPFIILGLSGFGAWWFVVNKPEPRKFSPAPQITRVDGVTISPTNYQVYLESRGTISPRTLTTLFPQVNGRIESISPNFRVGGYFKEGEILISIEKVDYEARLISAQSEITLARRVLAEEKVKGEQALLNWKRLRRSGTPSDLALRKPQYAEAKANFHAAEAALKIAERDLYRTDIRAPYDGRIIDQQVDVGQNVSQNTQLGRAFSTDLMEVRFPLTNQQVGFVQLPELYRDTEESPYRKPRVTITGGLGDLQSTWEGEIVRVDSSIDTQTRQLFAVAQIKDPYRRIKNQASPLKIGMFVDVVVEGSILENVFVLPRSTFRVSDEVVLIENDRIRRQSVTSIWKDRDNVLISADDGGLEIGNILCLTPLAYPKDGLQVLATVDGVKPKSTGPKGRKGKGGKKGKVQPDLTLSNART